ncbi:MAG: hypothetical protein IJF87_08625 [Erysipelotrichaceae bacterium]|nr:hypothetical protein [Erysipelotrichaceae bacterium]
MIVMKELIYFMFTLFLVVVLMCLQILSGWLLNTLFKELLDIDVITILRTRSKEKKNDKRK